MKRIFLILAIAGGLAGSSAEAQNGSIVIYRPSGKSFGVMHYGQGQHPTIVCDGANVARVAQNRKVRVEAVAGTHICSANEKQMPVENANSDTIPVGVKAKETTYLRLESHVGHVHFVLKEVPAETAQDEVKKLKPVKDDDVYIQVLMGNKGKGLGP